MYFCNLKKRTGPVVQFGLEYMPVTHGVASSSLVRTAKRKKSNSDELLFFFYVGSDKTVRGKIWRICFWLEIDCLLHKKSVRKNCGISNI